MFYGKYDKGYRTKIYNTFMQETISEDLKDFHAYIGIKRSTINMIKYRFPFMPCVEAIKWIITYMDKSHLMLCSESGSHLTTYYGEDI